MKLNFSKIENFKNCHQFWSYQLQKFFGDMFYSKVTPKKFWSCQLHFFGKNSIFSNIFFLILGYTTFFCSFLAFFFFEKWQIWRPEVAQLQKTFFWKKLQSICSSPPKSFGHISNTHFCNSKTKLLKILTQHGNKIERKVTLCCHIQY